MPSTDRDVFLRFFENPDISREVALIAYASFAGRKNMNGSPTLRRGKGRRPRLNE